MNDYITQGEIETILIIKRFEGTNNEYLDQC